MLPAATAARILAPASVALLLAIYNYFKSGAKTEVPDHMSPHPPGGSGSGGDPPRPRDDRAPPDLDPAVVDAIQNLVNARLEANRNFNNPAVPDESLKLLRNSDPADDIVDIVEKLCSEENKLACTNGPSSSSETESPAIVQGGGLDHAPSDLDPATLEEIRRLDPAVLNKMLKLGPLILDQIRNDRAVRFPPGDCWTYLKTGTCKDRLNCKFKHPPRSKDKQVSKDKDKKKEELAGKPGRTESKVSKDKEKKKEEMQEKPGRTESKAPANLPERSMPVPQPYGIDNSVTETTTDQQHPLEKRFLLVCDFFSKTGYCRKSSCEYHHPPKYQTSVSPSCELSEKGLPLRPVSKDKEKEKEGLAQKLGRPESKVSKDKAKEKKAKKPGRTESKNEFRSQGCKNGKAGMSNRSRGQPSGENFTGMPTQPNEFRSQGCKNGKAGISNRSRGQPSGENFTGMPTQPNGSRSEGRKNAKVRTSNHSRGQPTVAPAGENFLGLPIRPGKKNCPYYMQNGSCKHELSCIYNHPDPEAAGESDPVSRYGNGGHATFQGASLSTVEPSSAPRSLNRTPPYVPPMVIPPSQWGPSQNAELNSYQWGPSQQLPFSDSGANWE